MSYTLLTMSDDKDGGAIELRQDLSTAVYEKHGTVSDEKDMHRMGKLQQLRVSLTPLPAQHRCQMRLYADEMTISGTSNSCRFSASPSFWGIRGSSRWCRLALAFV